MIDKELLEVLKKEMMILAAKAQGAKCAYEQHVISAAMASIDEKGEFDCGDVIRVHYTKKDEFWVFKRVSFNASHMDEPYLAGVEITAKGIVSDDECVRRICKLSYLDNVKKSSLEEIAAISRAEEKRKSDARKAARLAVKLAADQAADRKAKGLHYIVAVDRAKNGAPYIALWGAEDVGVHFGLKNAGLVTTDKVVHYLGFYNSGNSSLAVPCDVLDAIAVPNGDSYGYPEEGPFVENNSENWKRILSSLTAAPRFTPKPEFAEVVK